MTDPDYELQNEILDRDRAEAMEYGRAEEAEAVALRDYHADQAYKAAKEARL